VIDLPPPEFAEKRIISVRAIDMTALSTEDQLLVAQAVEDYTTLTTQVLTMAGLLPMSEHIGKVLSSVPDLKWRRFKQDKIL